MAKPFASLSPAADHFSLLRGQQQQQQQQQQQEMSCRWRGAAPFTAAQWQELETQALIFKYFVAGVPVPPDLLMAVRTSFEAMAAARYYHHSLGYGAYFGKKVDPEPGRCRRTDGKKWRCAKEAAPDSKYCERHMHRGRNRSRKPVESQQVAVSVSVSHPPSPSGNSTITSSLPSPGNGNGIGMGIGTGMEMGIRNSNGNGTYVRSLSGGTGSSFGSATASHLQIDPAFFRYPYGVVRTAGTDEQRLFSEASGNLRGLSNVDTGTTWRMTQSPYSLNNSSTGTRDPAPPTLEAGAYQLPQAILTSGYAGGGVMRSPKLESCGAQAHAALHPFLDEWPRSGRNIGCWPELGDGNSNSNSNRNSFSSTQLSISIPMASSDFSTPSSCSPDDVQKSEDL